MIIIFQLRSLAEIKFVIRYSKVPLFWVRTCTDLDTMPPNFYTIDMKVRQISPKGIIQSIIFKESGSQFLMVT